MQTTVIHKPEQSDWALVTVAEQDFSDIEPDTLGFRVALLGLEDQMIVTGPAQL